jgi:hypothetical protein
MTFTLFAPLTPAECAARLTAAVDEDRFFSRSTWLGGKPVVGGVTERGIRLRKRIRYRNDFQTQLRATLRAVPGGTLIAGRCGMPVSVRIFMSIWFAGLVLLTAPFVYFGITSLLAGSGTARTSWIDAGMPLLMLGFGVGLIAFGRYLARDEAHFLKHFLVETLEAQEQVA